MSARGLGRVRKLVTQALTVAGAVRHRAAGDVDMCAHMWDFTHMCKEDHRHTGAHVCLCGAMKLT